MAKATTKKTTKSAATEARTKSTAKDFLVPTDTVTVVTANQDQGGSTVECKTDGPAINDAFRPKPTADVASSFNWWLDLTTNENWAYAHNVFTPEECEKIIEIGTRGIDATPLTYGSIGGGNGGVPSVEDTVGIRRSPVAWVRSDVAENRWIFERLVNHITGINKQFFNYDLTDIQSVQFTMYDGTEGGFYGKHIDMMYQGTGTRKLSVSVQLSDPDSYEGGDLLLHTRDDAERPFRNRGTANFFPSWTLHEVTPVTKGVRYSLVAWVQGPRFK